MQSLQHPTIKKLFNIIEELEKIVGEAEFLDMAPSGVGQVKDALNNLYWAVHDLEK